MMVKRRPLAALLLGACGLSFAANAAAQDPFDGDLAAGAISRGAADSNSRLLKRRRKHTVHKTSEEDTNDNDAERRRKLDFVPFDDSLDADLDLAFDIIDDTFEQYEDVDLSMPEGDTAENTQSACKSIIAVDGIRRRLDGQNDTATPSGDIDLDFAYQDEEEVDADEAFVCELQSGDTVPISGTSEQLAELRSLLHQGQLVSAISSVEVVTNANIEAIGVDAQTKDVNSLQEAVALPPGGIQLVDNSRRLANANQNNPYEGEKKVIVVRVTDKDGRAVPEDAQYVSDKFFGTKNDTATMNSGFEACSFGKLIMSYEYGEEIDSSVLSAPGVVDVQIGVSLVESSQAAIAAAARAMVQKKLKVSLPGPFDHVILVVESCHPVETSCAFAAWAYVNSWLSLFVGENYKYPAVTMHELGHNMNLAHSGGTDGRTYTDHTCLMGNPLFDDDISRMCYNPVKNNQIAASGSWYDEERIRVFDSGTGGPSSWRGKLIGVADYETNNSSHPIVLKLEAGTAPWFLGFNRATGVNANNQQASDLVTVYKVQNGGGLSYSQSSLKGYLGGGRSATIRGWRSTSNNLQIMVHEINLGESPGWADVEVTFEAQPSTRLPTEQPTSLPTKQTTSQPTVPPSVSPTASPTTSPITPNLSTNAAFGPLDAPNPTQTPTKKPTSKMKRFRLRTRSNPNDNANGQMFTVRAIKQVTMRSFDIVGKKDGDSNVVIYSRPGEYSGHEEDPDGWTLVLDKSITLTRGEQTNTGELAEKVTIPEGETQSFYIWSKKPMRSRRGGAEGGLVRGDGKLEIYEGVATKKLFQTPLGTARFSGGLRYEVEV
ncbi:hypothetical protein ACHAXT_012654 [Thalassiosira profunda]